MSTYTRRRHNPRGQDNIAGKRHDNVHTEAQYDVVPGRRADGVDQPFPNKPVCHRRPLNPKTQDSVGLYDFEKISITKQPRDPSLSQEYHSDGIRGSTASRHPIKDRLPSGELQMARAIHAKELMLQEKLWRAEEKIRQRLQRSAAACDGQKSEEERQDRRQAERAKALTKTRPSEQQGREPERSREMMMQGRRQEDVKQRRKRQDQSSEDRMRYTHEEERATWKRRETALVQSQRNRGKGTHEITVHGQGMSGALNKSRWENVKEHTRRRGGDEKDEKAKERGQSPRSVDAKGWAREKKSMFKEMYSSDDEQDVPQMSQQKTGAGRRPPREPQPPPVYSPEQGGLKLIDGPDAGLQLLPCRFCNRKFANERLEKHVQICKKVKQSHRQVFNSYVNRTKGSVIEDFYKTHSRVKTPEILKKKKSGQNQKANTRNLHEGCLPAGASQPKGSK